MGYNNNPKIEKIFNETKVLRKPISGIISGYHELPYIMIAPQEEKGNGSIIVNGKISVSPKFIITPSMLGDKYGEVFDPETFDKELTGRMFLFFYTSKKPVKIENEYFKLDFSEKSADNLIEETMDEIMRKEDTKTSVIFCPLFKYYPVSIDKFIREILDREFRV